MWARADEGDGGGGEGGDRSGVQERGRVQRGGVDVHSGGEEDVVGALPSLSLSLLSLWASVLLPPMCVNKATKTPNPQLSFLTLNSP